MPPIPSSRNVGAQNTPGDIKRLRRQVYDAMRRLGQPVLVKHMYNDQDVEQGVAQKSPLFQDPYGQVRNEDPFSHGIGFCSVELSADEWVAPDGSLVVSATRPSLDHVQAPKYRGFGEGYLTYMVEPDRAEDMFKLSPTGALIKIQNATAQAPWWPEINDNDLIVNVILDRQGNIATTHERFQAKMTSPISVRGLDRRGRKEYAHGEGNRFVVGQNFEMTLIPTTNVLMHVETDR